MHLIYRPLAMAALPLILSLVRPGLVTDPLDEHEVAKVGKIITWLIGIVTAIVIVVAFVFRFIVAVEIDQLRLELARDYARKNEIIGTPVYHAEAVTQDLRISRLETQMDELRNKVDQHGQVLQQNTETLGKIRR